MSLRHNRLIYIGIFFTLCFCIVLIRIYLLTFSKTKTEGKRNIVRGSISDRHNFRLAYSEEASTIAIAPQEIYDLELTAELLSKPLEMTPAEILQYSYERKNRRYFYLKRQVDNLRADSIVDLQIPGVYREREYRRQYPGNSLASNLLGFVGRDQAKALSGIERYFNSVLLRPVGQDIHKGAELQLTIDSLVQYHLELELSKAFLRSKSRRATALVMDVQTGAILAMANLPNFDPNKYYKSKPFRERKLGHTF